MCASWTGTERLDGGYLDGSHGMGDTFSMAFYSNKKKRVGFGLRRLNGSASEEGISLRMYGVTEAREMPLRT